MSKKLFGKFFIFLLVVGLLFAVAPTGQAQAAAIVNDEAGLRLALAGTETQIELGASFTLAATVDVNRAVSIDGKNFTITGPAKGTEIWEGHGLDVTANNVSISNLTITGSGRSNLVFYNVTGGSVTNVILSNAAHAGMIVNSSTVTINNVTTINNTWGGINVDRGGGLTTDPLLIVQNVTTHTSPAGRITPAIWVDSGNAAWVSGEDGLYVGLTAPALVYYDNTEFAAATVFNVRTGVKYLTIQAAIDAAMAGDAIYVPAGTYAEDVDVTKPVTLLGPNAGIPGNGTRVAEAIIKGTPASWVSLYVEPNTPGVTIDGFKFDGANLAPDGYSAGVAGDSSDLTVQNNVFVNHDHIAIITSGVYTPDGGATWLYDKWLTDVLIKDNLIINDVASLSPYNYGIYFQSSLGSVTGNVVTNYRSGIQVQPYWNTPGGGTIEGNTFNVYKLGIWFNYTQNVTANWLFKDNVITGLPLPTGQADTPWEGIVVQTFDDGSVSFIENQVSFGTASSTVKYSYHEVDVTDGVSNASPNWWGSATGPAAGTFVGAADYIPWCGEPACETMVYPPVHNTTQGTWYNTIQAAVDAAADNNAIIVAAGTYEGFRVVGKTGLTITGAGDAATIIAPTALIDTGVGHKYTPSMLASVFVNNSTGITIEGMAIKSTVAAPGAGGADAIVFWNNSTGFIKESIVLGLYTINGNQTGQGIAVDGGTSVLSLVNTNISGFNKNAIDVVDGNGGTTVPGNLTVNVSGGTITGAGPITATAQNGVSFWNRAGGVLGGSITGATISGFDYTPTSNEATGILAYGLGGGTLTVSGNTFSASEVFMTDITGTLNLYSILTGNTFPAYSAVIGDSIKVSPTKMLMDPATFATTDTCTGTHEVIVKVQEVTDLAGYYLNMTYNKDLITVTNVENLTLVGAAAPLNSWTNGEIHFGWAPVTGAGDPVTFDGNVDLVKITFRSNGLAGTSAFTILPSSALEEWPNSFGITFEITGGASVSFGSIVTNTTAEPDKAYCDLAVAVAQATGGDTLRVDANITNNSVVYISKALTLDTNGKTISRDASIAGTNSSFVVTNTGDLTITGGGTITTTTGNAIYIFGFTTGQAKVTLQSGTLYGPNASVAIVGNTSFTGHATVRKALFVMTGGQTNETVMVQGNGAEADITGGVLTGNAPIMGNGTVSATENINNGGTKITVGGTAVVGSPTLGMAAIFHPQDGLLTINGGTIIGTNGIEMDAGDLVITGGTIQATGLCLETPVETPEDGSTNTGDAILILHQNNYTAGDQMHVTISGSPTIISNNCYALRELDFGGNTSELALATITGGHYTGGALGAVYFATNNANNLELVGGDYSADPIAYVYAPYGTYLNTDSRWYIAPLPVISSTDFEDQVTLGVPTTFNLTVDPSVPGTFDMVFTGYPSETQITYGVTTYLCVGDPCVITVPVTLTGVTPVTLPFAITVATAGTETPLVSYPVSVTMHAPAPTYGTTGRDLATLSATVPVTPGFSVSGTVTMQGRMTRADIPVYLTWENTLGVTYGPSMDTDEAAVNFRLAVNYGGTYTITTLQPRYLNITADLLKQVTLTGNYTFANPLWLRAGNAMWQTAAGVYDNTIGVTDAQKVFTTWNTAGGTDALDNSGDVNFDGLVTIKDLTLVGGNMDLTSATAYGGTNNWLP